MKRILLAALMAASMAMSQRTVCADPSSAPHASPGYSATSKNEAKDDSPNERATRLEAAAEAIGKLDHGEVSASDQSKLLKMAASLAELAGQDKDAKHLREEAEKDHPPLDAAELIARRQAQLDTLQAQLDGLRRLTRTERQILVRVTLLEFSRAKLQAAGIEFPLPLLGTGETKTTGAPPADERGLAKPLGPIDNADALFAKLDSLRAKGLIKVLAEPALVTVSGRPAHFNSGGEFPYPRREGHEQPTVAFLQFGTQVDLLPSAMGNERIRLEVHGRFSKIHPDVTVSVGGADIPGVNAREYNTLVECNSGQACIVGHLASTSKLETLDSAPQKQPAASADSTDNSTGQTELIMLVSPSFVQPSDSQKAVGTAARAGYYAPATGKSLELPAGRK